MAGPSSTETVRLEQEMRESTTRSVQLLNEAFYVGTKTNEELDRQYESLEREYGIFGSKTTVRVIVASKYQQ